MHEPNISKKIKLSGQWNSSRIIHEIKGGIINGKLLLF